MWLTYWLLLLLSFRSFPAQCMGLGSLHRPDHPVADMCSSACAVPRHRLEEAPRLENKENQITIFILHLSVSGILHKVFMIVSILRPETASCI